MTETQEQYAQSDSEKLINAGITIDVGGAGEDPITKRVTIREPNNRRLGTHISMMREAVSLAIKDNWPFFWAVMNDPEKLGPEDMMQFGVVADSIASVVGDLVGEDAEWVAEQMTGRQTVEVWEAYLGLIGWDYVVSAFTLARRSWTQALTAAQTETATEQQTEAGIPMAPTLSAEPS